MKRIRSKGCGYEYLSGTTYTCSGIPKFHSIFATTDVYAYGSTSTSDAAWVSTIDNYAQLPQEFEGFVMTLTPVLDMNSAKVEVPELSCRVNMDPFQECQPSVLNGDLPVSVVAADSGFLDLWQTVPGYADVVYEVVDGSTSTMLSTMPVVLQPPEQAESDDIVYTVGPGILEPMLDTMFPPIGIDTITEAGVIGDWAVMEFNVVDQWRRVVDDRLRNIYTVAQPTDFRRSNALLNLENAKNIHGICDNFTITATTDQVILPVSSTNTPQYYDISGGTVHIDNNVVIVEGTTSYSNQFAAYLDIFTRTPTEDDQSIYGATITTDNGYGVSGLVPADTHVKFEYIGGVVRVEGGTVPERDAEQYALYEIQQGDCLYEISLSGGTGGGGGGSTCSCEPYMGPFALIQGSTSGTVRLHAFDEIDDDVRLKTGLVKYGSDTLAIDIETFSVSGEKDIYLTLDFTNPEAPVPGWEIVPEASTESATSATTTESTPSAEDTATDTEAASATDDQDPDPNVMHIRIGRVSAGPLIYDEVTLIDTPATGTASVAGTTVRVFTDFISDGAIVEPSLYPILLDTDVPFYVTGGTVFEVSGGTLTGSYGVAPSGGTFAAVAHAKQMIDITQVQYGDIVLGAPEPQHDDPGGNVYNGPFKLVGGTSSVSFECLEKDNNNNCVSIGDIVMNGETRYPVPPSDASVEISGASPQFVYAHVTGTNSVVFDTASTYSGTPPAYTVRLARITGTVTSSVVSGTTIYSMDGEVSVDQFHYGDIYVDGRWL